MYTYNIQCFIIPILLFMIIIVWIQVVSWEVYQVYFRW